MENANESIPVLDQMLVPYNQPGWTVILRDESRGQLVLYDSQKQQIAVRPLISQVPPSHQPRVCFMCGHHLDPEITKPSVPTTTCSNPTFGDSSFVSESDRSKPMQTDTLQANSVPTEDIPPLAFMDTKYFQLLDMSTRDACHSIQENSEVGNASDVHLPQTAFNPGYYEQFFQEIKRLGRGYRGSVFLCRHVLDKVPLGDFAIKKIPVGDNKKWLTRMLSEVRVLEGIRHFHIVEYKHCWLEDHQLTPFGPPVPCLFVLMELANGGNLEEYVLQRSASEMKRKEEETRPPRRKRLDSASASTSEQLAAEQGSGLSVHEIWNFFLDICSGLEHLHKHGIIHRDLLLKYKNPQNPRELPRVVISDFGESEDLFHPRELNKRTGHTGTLEFTAPEMLRSDRFGQYLAEYTPTSDIWSLGMILFYLCYSRLPYSNLEDVDLLKKDILTFKQISIQDLRLIRSDLPIEMLHLMRLLLSPNPRDRPPASSILKRCWSMRDAPVESTNTERSPLRRSLPTVPTPDTGLFKNIALANAMRSFCNWACPDNETRSDMFSYGFVLIKLWSVWIVGFSSPVGLALLSLAPVDFVFLESLLDFTELPYILSHTFPIACERLSRERIVTIRGSVHRSARPITRTIKQFVQCGRTIFHACISHDMTYSSASYG